VALPLFQKIAESDWADVIVEFLQNLVLKTLLAVNVPLFL
jgi:hypothetical protein